MTYEIAVWAGDSDNLEMFWFSNFGEYSESRVFDCPKEKNFNSRLTIAVVHRLPVSTACLLRSLLSLWGIEDLASGLQFNMWVKVIWESSHKEGCSSMNRAFFISSSSIKEGSLQATKWFLSQEEQREIILSREQKSTGDNGASVSHSKRLKYLICLK